MHIKELQVAQHLEAFLQILCFLRNLSGRCTKTQQPPESANVELKGTSPPRRLKTMGR